jgi:hypothetical protein
LPDKKYTFRKEFVRHSGFHGLIDWKNMPENEKQRNKEWVKITKEVLNINKLDIKFIN